MSDLDDIARAARQVAYEYADPMPPPPVPPAASDHLARAADAARQGNFDFDDPTPHGQDPRTRLAWQRRTIELERQVFWIKFYLVASWLINLLLAFAAAYNLSRIR